MQRFSRGILAIAVGLALTGNALARPIVPAEKRYRDYSGELPPCDDPGVLERITSRFQQKESEYWNSALEIQGYDRIKSIGIRPWGLDHIPRTFCVAIAHLNDRSVHEVSYSVAEDLGIIGFGYGVEWCVEGLDRNYAYAPDCKMARP
jgi:hypothetical protein